MRDGYEWLVKKGLKKPAWYNLFKLNMRHQYDVAMEIHNKTKYS